MSNGFIYGADRTPTLASASGLWTPEDVRLAMQKQTWPSGNVQVEVGSFTKQTTTGNQDITIATDLTNAPAGSWAVMFWTTGSAAASGIWYSGWQVYGMLGFVANGGGTISQYSVCARSADAQPTSATARRMAATAITAPNEAGSGVDFEASFSSFPTAATMRLNWATNHVQATVINYAIISGLTGAKVVEYAGGTTSLTGAGFNPDLMLFAATRTPAGAPPFSGADAAFGFGAANKHGQAWANGFNSKDAASPSNTDRYQQTDAVIAFPTDTGAINTQAQFAGTHADGCTLSWTDNNLCRFAVLYMGGISSKIGAFSKADGVAANTVASRHGFTVKGALFCSVERGATGGVGVDAAWMLGASDNISQRAAGLRDEDAVNPSQADSLWRSDKVITVPDAGPTEPNTAAWTSSTSNDFTVTFANAAGSNGMEFLYLLLGHQGTATFPANLIAGGTTNSLATAYSNQKKVVVLSTGRIVAIHNGPSGGMVWYSDTGQSPWTNYAGTTIDGWSNGSIGSYVDSGGTERLVAAWKQSGTGGGRADQVIYCTVGAFSSDRTTLTWGTAVQVYAGGNGPYNYPDLVVQPEGTGGYVTLVMSYSDGATANYCDGYKASIGSTGVLGVFSTAFSSGPYGAAPHTFPSIDYDPITKRLFVAWSAGTTGAGKGIRFRTASYSAGPMWTWAAEVEVSAGHYCYDSWRAILARWDANRSLCVLMGHVYTGPANKMSVWDSSNFTAFTNRLDQTVIGTTDILYGFGGAIDPNNGDIYMFGSNYDAVSNCRNVHYHKATRSGSTLTTGSLVTTESFYGPTAPPYVYAFPNTSGIGWVYTHGNNAPYSVKYDRLQLG